MKVSDLINPTIVPEGTTALMASDGAITIHIPQDREMMTDDQIFLTACFMLWHSEDEEDQDLVAAMVEHVYDMADGVKDEQ